MQQSPEKISGTPIALISVGKKKTNQGSWRVTMCGRRLSAVMLAAMVNVGAYAMQPGEEGSSPATGAKASVIEAARFFDDASLSSDRYQRPFPTQVSLTVPTDRPAVMHTPSARKFIVLPPSDPPAQADLPLVPLPPPVWTGMAGLIGLGAIRMFNSICRSLR
jgi:hypothetical protein